MVEFFVIINEEIVANKDPFPRMCRVEFGRRVLSVAVSQGVLDHACQWLICFLDHVVQI